MNEATFREAIKYGRTHLRAACKALYQALGFANGQAPAFVFVVDAAAAALQLLAKVETDSGASVVEEFDEASKRWQSEGLGSASPELSMEKGCVMWEAVLNFITAGKTF
jgi:hypothetical protein